MTKVLRKLVRDYRLLAPKDRHFIETGGGLFGSIRLLRELLELFWELNRRLDEIDEQQSTLALRITSDPEEVDPSCPEIPDK